MFGIHETTMVTIALFCGEPHPVDTLTTSSASLLHRIHA